MLDNFFDGHRFEVADFAVGTKVVVVEAEGLEVGGDGEVLECWEGDGFAVAAGEDLDVTEMLRAVL